MNYKKFQDYQEQVNQAKKLAREKRKSETVPKQKGIVIFLDALGTKGIWNKKEETTKIINSWTTYTKNFEKTNQKNKSYFTIKIY